MILSICWTYLPVVWFAGFSNKSQTHRFLSGINLSTFDNIIPNWNFHTSSPRHVSQSIHLLFILNISWTYLPGVWFARFSNKSQTHRFLSGENSTTFYNIITTWNFDSLNPHIQLSQALLNISWWGLVCQIYERIADCQVLIWSQLELIWHFEECLHFLDF